MSKVLLVAVLMALAGTADARTASQSPPAPPQPAASPGPSPGPAPQTPVAPRPAQPKTQKTQETTPPPRAQQPSPGRFNIEIELTITDQTGTAPPEKKTVTLLAADRTYGRVRASADASNPNMGRVGTTLNVDARPTIMEGNIFLELTVEYRPLLASTASPSPTGKENEYIGPRTPTNLHESLSVILISGKPMILSQAADPISDRRMTVEVKATVLK